VKLDHLPLGARFQYKGQTYSKVGPMTGASERGGTMFIPKHAVLQPVPGEAPPAPPKPRSLDSTTVLAAFETYHRRAVAMVNEEGREQLEVAKASFLATLR